MLTKLIFKVVAFLSSLILFCNGNIDDMARLVDGKDAEQKDWYFMASLYERSKDSSTKYFRFCGGAIITKWHILTTAHCLINNSIKLKPEDILVVAGSTYIKMFLDLKNTKNLVAYRSVQSLTFHPKYNHKKVANDIAILKLKERFIFDLQKIGSIPIETPLTKPKGTITSS